MLKGKPRYVGLVASRKRAEAVFAYLREQGISDETLKQIKAPAGLDIQAQQGDEIALSILAEIVQRRRTAPAARSWNALEPEEIAPSVTQSAIAIDPVCQMEVEIASAKYIYDYHGTTYYFCAPGCKRSFAKDPESYLNTAVNHAPEA